LNLHIVPRVEKLRTAVIGAGVFGRLHMAKYQALDGVELVAVADPSRKARSAAELKFGVKTHADWRELKSVIDVVSICSPASTHAEVIRGFLEAGVHVLVEKPIATNLEEADELIALAAAKGLVLNVGHQERLVFDHCGLLSFTDAPLSIESVRAGPWTGRCTDVGAVMDLMTHDLDLIHRLVPGEIDEVRAAGRVMAGPFVDEMTANLSFEDGCEVKLFASRIAETRERSMRLVYADGVIEFDFLTRSIRNTTKRALQPLELADPLGDEIASFITEVEGGPMSLVRPEEARRALETALLIEDAAAQGVPAAHNVQAPVGVALSA
jgi:predicted dehydrogenase